jgi:hypothetical protein
MRAVAFCKRLFFVYFREVIMKDENYIKVSKRDCIADFPMIE